MTYEKLHEAQPLSDIFELYIFLLFVANTPLNRLPKLYCRFVVQFLLLYLIK